MTDEPKVPKKYSYYMTDMYEQGQALADLGLLLQNPNSTIEDLCEQAAGAGLWMQISFNPYSKEKKG